MPNERRQRKMLNNSNELLRKNWLLYLDTENTYKVYYKKTFVGQIQITDKDVLWNNVINLLFRDGLTPRTLLAVYIANPDDIEFVKSGKKYYFIDLDRNSYFLNILEAEDTDRNIDIHRKAAGNFFPADKYTPEDIDKNIRTVLSDSMPNIVKSIHTNMRKNNV